MKMTAILGGLTLAHNTIDNSGIHHVDMDTDHLILADGTVIYYDGDENDGPNDCFNYADWSALNDTGFWQDKTVNAQTLRLEEAEDGFKINGYFVPCYSSQNGYYTNEISIYVRFGDSKAVGKCAIRSL